MDFTVDVILVEQPLCVTASQSTQDGTGRAGNERKHATGAEILDVERRRPDRLTQAPGIRQVALQRIAHDVLQAQPLESGLGLGMAEQVPRNVDCRSHQATLTSYMFLCAACRDD